MKPFDITISKDKAKQIAESALLDLDVQVSELLGNYEKKYSASIVNERTNLALCQTDEIFVSEEHAKLVLNKVIAALQTNSKSKKFTTEICYNLKID